MTRGIFIGDVHGCRSELEALLSGLALTTTDRVVFVGDLVARGPDSRGVIALARRLGALAVRGNHEHRLLLAHAARAAGTAGPHLSPGHERLLLELEAEDFAWLTGLPTFLDRPEHGLRVLHAGLVPGRPIEEQDVEHLVHLRTILPDGTPSSRLDGRPWGALYAGPPHVVFGHDALTGLQLHPHATGLDTGCVYGGALSALVLASGASPPAAVAERRECIVSVRAQRAYVAIAGR